MGRRREQDDLISISDFYDLLKSSAGFIFGGLELEFEALQLGGSFNTVPARCRGLITCKLSVGNSPLQQTEVADGLCSGLDLVLTLVYIMRSVLPSMPLTLYVDYACTYNDNK